MRRICVPPSLMPLQLAEFQDLPATLRKMLALDVPLNPKLLAFDEALAIAENALTVVRNQRDRNSEALINLYSADLFWRSERWLEALEMASAAASWFKLQSSPIARYNEAIAVYFNGLLHFCLHADTRAMPLFMEAQSQLEESRQYWSVHTGREYFEACDITSQWIGALVPLRTKTPPGSHTLIIPVYPYHNRTASVIIEAVAITLDALQTPVGLLDFNYLAMPDWIPLEVGKLSLLDVRPGTVYFGVRLDEDETWLPDGKAGDIVVVEALLPLALANDQALGGSVQTFTRQTDGTFMLREPQQRGQGFVGIPRLLLRRGGRS